MWSSSNYRRFLKDLAKKVLNMSKVGGFYSLSGTVTQCSTTLTGNIFFLYLSFPYFNVCLLPLLQSLLASEKTWFCPFMATQMAAAKTVSSSLCPLQTEQTMVSQTHCPSHASAPEQSSWPSAGPDKEHQCLFLYWTASNWAPHLTCHITA